MPRFKVLKGVAHNLGHSFTSLMNYAGDDYVMGHLLKFARRSGKDTLTIDLVTGEAEPIELLAQPVSDVTSRYSKFFWHLVQVHGSDRSYVQSATLSLRYNLSIQRPTPHAIGFAESPYVCEVRVKDSRGKNYDAHFEGWWYPEQLHKLDLKARHWQKVWTWVWSRFMQRKNSEIIQ
jgi:hypothetical protein